MKLKKQFRALPFNGVKLDKEKRTIEFPFSSEQPVERYWGTEILQQDTNAADLTRLNDGAPLLWNHNTDQVIGVVERAWMGSDKRGYAQVRFSKNDEAQKIMSDVEDGIIRNVSFGYRNIEMDIRDARSDNPEFLVTRWEAYEVSLVSIPADNSVGLGRSDKDSEKEKEVLVRSLEPKEKEKEMEPTKIETPKIDVDAIVAEKVKAETDRIAEITAMGKRFNQEELARQLVEGKRPLDEARKVIMEKIDIKQTPIDPNAADIGLSKKEIKEFKLIRAINALANPTNQKLRDEAAFEFEVSAAAAKKMKTESRGVMIPNDILNKRDLVVGTSSAAGDLVASQLRPENFVELLINQTALGRLGVTILGGLVGNQLIPRQTSAASITWVGENSAGSESALAVDQISLSPKTASVYSDYSRQLLMQSTPSIDQLVQNDLRAGIAIAVDAAGFYGLGSSNQPTGLKATAGVGVEDFAGSLPTFAEIVDMESKVAAANALSGGAAKYITNAKGRGALKTTEKSASGTVGNFIWDAGNQVNGYECLVSEQIATLSSTDPDFFFGVWKDLILALWGSLDILVDPYTGSSAGTVRIVAFQSVDFAVRHAASFCYGNKTAP